ncbi:MAG: internal scaffolding protein [Microviridae sp.]|nr:MAG: internal scaffolding protein [Microviridae sp.]
MAWLIRLQVKYLLRKGDYMKTNVINPFTLDLDAHALEHGISFPEPSLTVQADKEQADINNIVKQFGVTNMLPYGKQAFTGEDFTDLPTDYHTAMNIVRDSDDYFMQFPANIRSRFDNDAGKLLDFINDSSNYDEAVKLGFIQAPQQAPAESEQPAGAEGTLPT